MENGLIHLYHGEGKGKTTAAVGLAIRAVGNEEQVLFAQFMKDGKSGEVPVLQGLEKVCYLCGEKMPHGFYKTLNDEQKKAFQCSQQDLFKRIQQIVTEVSDENGALLILDEFTYAYSWGLIDQNEALVFLKEKPKNLEVVITGREPAEELLAISDYITEMKLQKHPFLNGIPARKGIEF